MCASSMGCQSYSKALKYSKKALPMMQELHNGEAHSDIATLLWDMSRYEAYFGRNLEALAYGEMAVAAMRKVDKTNVCFARWLFQVAVYSANCHRYKEALEYGEEVLALKRKRCSIGRPPDAEMATLLSNMASYCEQLKKYKEAIDYGQEALAIVEKLRDDDRDCVDLADLLRCMAACYLWLGRHEESLSYRERCTLLNHKK
jgi:tetratricopeptide (TPR) repeat protein